MNVKKISSNITIRPTNKKMQEAKRTARDLTEWAYEEPIEKKVYIVPMSELFERVKDRISITIENMKGQK